MSPAQRFMAIAAAASAVIALAACSSDGSTGIDPSPSTAATASPSASPSASAAPTAEERQADYDATVAAFPFELAPNFTFPESVPDEPDSTGEQAAYGVWRCGLLVAAVSAPDREARLALLETADQVDWDVLPPRVTNADPSSWVDSPGALGVEYDMCQSWYT